MQVLCVHSREETVSPGSANQLKKGIKTTTVCKRKLLIIGPWPFFSPLGIQETPLVLRYHCYIQMSPIVNHDILKFYQWNFQQMKQKRYTAQGDQKKRCTGNCFDKYFISKFYSIPRSLGHILLTLLSDKTESLLSHVNFCCRGKWCGSLRHLTF